MLVASSTDTSTFPLSRLLTPGAMYRIAFSGINAWRIGIGTSRRTKTRFST